MLDFSNPQPLPFRRRLDLVRGFLDGRLLGSLDLAWQGLSSDEEREQIAQHYLQTTIVKPKSSPRKPLLVVLGGGPASGKSTLARRMNERLDAENVFINMNGEKCRAVMPEFRALRYLDEQPDVVAALDLSPAQIKQCRDGAQRFVAREVTGLISRGFDQAVAIGASVINESHMHVYRVNVERMKQMRRAGYFNLMLQMDVDVPTFFRYGQTREATTGKPFYPQLGLDHHQRFESLWPKFARAFDMAVRIDNNGAEPEPMAVSEFGGIRMLKPEAYVRARLKRFIKPEAATPEEALAYPPETTVDMFHEAAKELGYRSKPFPPAAQSRLVRQLGFTLEAGQ
jgi:hypothetical protein